MNHKIIFDEHIVCIFPENIISRFDVSVNDVAKEFAEKLRFKIKWAIKELVVSTTPTGQFLNFRSLPTVNKGLKFHYLSYILCEINGVLLLENDLKT